MGSQSDWETMRHASQTLTDLAIPHERLVVSAHRAPKLLIKYATTAAKRRLKLIIAGAGVAAHLPGVTAALTHLPVLGVPIEGKALKGLDALLAIVQMPPGVPVATFAIGKSGATNAALFAAAMLAGEDRFVEQALLGYRARQTAKVLAIGDPLDHADSGPTAKRRKPAKRLRTAK